MTDEIKPDEVPVTDPATAETADPGDQPPPKSADEAKTEAEKPATDAAPDGADDEAEKKRKQTARERINELTKQKREFQREAEREKARADRLEELSKAPDPANYDDLDKLQTDQAASAAARIRHAELKDGAEDASTKANEAKAMMWSAKVSEFKANAPDFEAVAYSAPLTDSMANTIPELDEGPAVAYYLGKNPVEAAQIAQLPEREQAIALGRIEGRLSIPPARKVSQAPEPVQTVGGKGTTAPPNLSKANMSEYVKIRQAQMKGN